MSQSRRIDITPDKTLVRKLGLTGYKTEEAIEELIDNSIDGRLENKTTLINVNLDFVEKRITIDDDGKGMDFDELRDGLTIAKEKKRSKKELGQFGIGMKSACSTLGKRFTIITSTTTSNKILTAEYDEEEWLRDKKINWRNFKVKEEKKNDDWHGTKIIIEKLNVVLYPNQLTNFKKHFGERYGTYIEKDHIQIKINHISCKPQLRLLDPDSRQEVSIKTKTGHTIKGWIALTQQRTTKSNFGFNLYKTNRLVTSNDKLTAVDGTSVLRAHPEVSRIVGEFHFDHVPVNILKTKFITDSPEYIEAVEAIKVQPYLIKLLSTETYKMQDRVASVDAAYGYLLGKNPTKTFIKTQISAEGARKILDSAPPLEFKRNFREIEIKYEDLEENKLYTIERTRTKIVVIINKNSGGFKAVKNPLFLIALIQIESELLSENVHDLQEFIQKRNKRWVQFVNDLAPKPKPKRKSVKTQKITDESRYHVANELVGVYQLVNEKFESKCQFTALCTLSTHLEYAQAKIFYTIYTANGGGQYLHDFLHQHARGFSILLNPEKRDIDTTLNISESKKIIIIREYAEDEIKSIIASPEKAWMDLYREIKYNHLPIPESELLVILDSLKDLNLVKLSTIHSIAKHRKNYDEIIKYTNQVFGE